MQPVWQLKWLSIIIWAGNSQYFKRVRVRLEVTKAKKETEKERKEGEQACSSEAFHHPPNSCSFPLPSSSSWKRERGRETEQGREREREQQRASERVTLTRQRRRDVKRRIYKGKKSFSPFSFLSSCMLRAARSEEERRGPGLHIFYAASLQFLWLYHSAWSTGRAADSLIGDIAPQ